MSFLFSYCIIGVAINQLRLEIGIFFLTTETGQDSNAQFYRRDRELRLKREVTLINFVELGHRVQEKEERSIYALEGKREEVQVEFGRENIA